MHFGDLCAFLFSFVSVRQTTSDVPVALKAKDAGIFDECGEIERAGGHLDKSKFLNGGDDGGGFGGIDLTANSQTSVPAVAFVNAQPELGSIYENSGDDGRDKSSVNGLEVNPAYDLEGTPGVIVISPRVSPVESSNVVGSELLDPRDIAASSVRSHMFELRFGSKRRVSLSADSKDRTSEPESLDLPVGGCNSPHSVSELARLNVDYADSGSLGAAVTGRNIFGGVEYSVSVQLRKNFKAVDAIPDGVRFILVDVSPLTVDFYTTRSQYGTTINDFTADAVHRFDFWFHSMRTLYDAEGARVYNDEESGDGFLDLIIRTTSSSSSDGILRAKIYRIVGEPESLTLVLATELSRGSVQFIRVRVSIDRNDF